MRFESYRGQAPAQKRQLPYDRDAITTALQHEDTPWGFFVKYDESSTYYNNMRDAKAAADGRNIFAFYLSHRDDGTPMLDQVSLRIHNRIQVSLRAGFDVAREGNSRLASVIELTTEVVSAICESAKLGNFQMDAFLAEQFPWLSLDGDVEKNDNGEILAKHYAPAKGRSKAKAKATKA